MLYLNIVSIVYNHLNVFFRSLLSITTVNSVFFYGPLKIKLHGRIYIMLIFNNMKDDFESTLWLMHVYLF